MLRDIFRPVLTLVSLPQFTMELTMFPMRKAFFFYPGNPPLCLFALKINPFPFHPLRHTDNSKKGSRFSGKNGRGIEKKCHLFPPFVSCVVPFYAQLQVKQVGKCVPPVCLHLLLDGAAPPHCLPLFAWFLCAVFWLVICSEHVPLATHLWCPGDDPSVPTCCQTIASCGSDYLQF